MSMLVAERQYESETNKARLRQIIEEKSLTRRPDIKLASGATSTFYFNMKPTTFDPEGASLISDLIIEALGSERVDLIGGLEMGAVPIVACVCQRTYSANVSRSIPGFFVRKHRKSHGTRQLFEGIGEGVSLRGKRAVLVDDVTTTGGSVLQAVRAARDQGCIVNKVITVVDRLEGAKENLAQHEIELVPLLTARDFDL